MTYDGWTFTWEHGRELAAMSKAGVNWQFTYDANGMRTSRTNGATTYRYIYNGGQLTQMHKGADVLHFIYDAGGTQVALIYNGSVYYYLTTLQGDTFAIADSDGTIVVEYIYDAWGNVQSITGSMASTLGTLNPLRYRGYVYDQETNLYYLQSRYYNPEWGRFLNADTFVSTGQGILGNNMFAYCGNNPVVGYDPSGNAPLNVFFSVCYGGAGGKAISGNSDGLRMSDDLLDYVSNNYVFCTDATVYIDVQHTGIYTHTIEKTIADVSALLGGLGLLAFTPAVREVSCLSAIFTGAGIVSSAYGFLGLLSSKSLPAKDYYQYKVTISWTDTNTVTGYSNVFVRTDYHVEMWFLWNDVSYTSPYWYVQSSSWQAFGTEYRLG